MSDEETETQSNEAQPGAGARLRAARETQGLRVATVAEALGLPAAVIHALEDDDFGRLGAPVYVRGYLRKYARYLDLAGDELVAAYEQASAPHDPQLQSRLATGVSPPSGRRWLAATVTVLVIAVIVVVAIWAWRYLRLGQETTSIPPAAAASAAPALIQDAQAMSHDAALTVSSAATSRQAVTLPAQRTSPSVAAAIAETTADRVQSPVAKGEPQLTLRVHSTSWIEVRAADHTRLYYDLAPTGAVLNFDGRHGDLTVLIGNLKGVEVVVNGRPYSIPASARTGNTVRFEVALTTRDKQDRSQ